MYREIGAIRAITNAAVTQGQLVKVVATVAGDDAIRVTPTTATTDTFIGVVNTSKAAGEYCELLPLYAGTVELLVKIIGGSRPTRPGRTLYTYYNAADTARVTNDSAAAATSIPVGVVVEPSTDAGQASGDEIYCWAVIFRNVYDTP